MRRSRRALAGAVTVQAHDSTGTRNVLDPRRMRDTARAALLAAFVASCAPSPPSEPSPRSTVDLLIRGGIVYDGGGSEVLLGRRRDRRRQHRRRGSRPDARAARDTLDARGMAVAPGFINMLSWGFDELLPGRQGRERPAPGRHAGDLRRRAVAGPGQRASRPRAARPGRHARIRGASARRWTLSSRAACP